MYDTIIIGAGMSGLAAGVRLAHYDQKVCILERHSVVGGLNSYYRQRGRNHDVGLHAVTNFQPKGVRKGPLARLLKQLRLAWDELGLVPQSGSSIRFPDLTLRFNNDFTLLESEIRKHFPKESDGVQKLIGALVDYDDLGKTVNVSARSVVKEYIKSPLLTDMLFCPLMYYGSAIEDDMDFNQFSIMFRSIFLEGFARPMGGVRDLLCKLVNRFKEDGGELRTKAGVKRLLQRDNQVYGVELDNGEIIESRHVLSSAGWRETLGLCDPGAVKQDKPGQLAFVETISVLDKQPKQFGHNDTIVFFNDSPKFAYHKPDGLVDLRSGVICSPNNFNYSQPLQDNVIRITALANFEKWHGLPQKEYALEKLRWYDRISQSAARFVPDFRGSVIDTDMFTPTTITRFTGHENGAIYGAPVKQYSGQTPIKNLYVCGTDQGMVGIIGSLVSGITIANQYCLQD